MTAHFFIKKAVVAASRRDMYLILADHVVNDISMYAGSVNYIFCRIFAVIRAKVPDAVRIGFYVFYLCIETEFYAVFRCVFSHGNIQNERTDDAACGCVKRSLDIFAEVRFHLERRFS